MNFTKRNYINLGAALLMYAASVLSLLILDIYISTNLEKQIVSEWAFLKAFFLIIVSTVSMGYDSIILRQYNIKKYIQSYIYNLIIYSCAVGFFFYLYKDSIDFYFIIIFCLFMGFSTLLSAYFKKQNKIILSQLSINGWKLIFPLFFILLSTYSMSLAFLFSVLFSFCITAYFFYKYQNHNKKLGLSSKDEIIDNKEGKLPIVFLFINLITLAVATNGEQIILNNFSSPHVSYLIFIYTLIFCSIISGISGFLGFYLVSYFNKINMSLKIYNKYKNAIYLIFLIIFFINFVAGCILMNLLYGEIDYLLAAIFCFIGVIRFLYVIYSVLMTLYANISALKCISVINLFFTILYICLFIILSSFDISYNLYVISLLILLHWLFRLMVMNLLTIRSWIS